MKTIYKFILPIEDSSIIMMPKGTKLLSVQNQDGKICIWAEVESNNVKTPREFEVHGTGNQMRELYKYDEREFLGTVQVDAFVWHIFEVVTVIN